MHKLIIASVFIANLTAVIAFWWLGSSVLLLGGSAGGVAIALGRLAGLLAEFLILVELILISRIEKTYGFDRLNRIHRWIGYGLLAGIVSHPLLLVIGYSQLNQVSLISQYSNFIFSGQWEDVSKAFIGLSLLIAVAFLSLPYFRRILKYETWHGIHLLMYVAIGLFFGHQVNTGDVSFGTAFFYWYALNFVIFGILILYRFMRPLIVSAWQGFSVDKVIQEGPGVWSVYIIGKHIEQFAFEAGQYIQVSFLAKGFWQPHPFSFSTTPNDNHIRITIKAIGDYTSKIGELKPGTKVIIDGPLGRFTERASSRQKYLFIAGGIGITPIRSLIESVSKQSKDLVLLYGVRDVPDLIFKSEIEKMTGNAHYILSQSVASGYDKGHIDEAILRKYAPDFLEREIYICGPPIMMDILSKLFRTMGVNRSQIHLEKF